MTDLTRVIKCEPAQVEEAPTESRDKVKGEEKDRDREREREREGERGVMGC